MPRSQAPSGSTPTRPAVDVPRQFWRASVLAITVAVLLLVVPLAAQSPLVNCGGENERACGITDPELVLNGGASCDRGLKELEGVCRNSSRRVVNVDAWVDWAVRNQLTLAIDEPINWVSRLGTHNSFNAFNDGYPLPNQGWSMTDQLRLGARHLDIDLHPVGSHVTALSWNGDPLGLQRLRSHLRLWHQGNSQLAEL